MLVVIFISNGDQYSKNETLKLFLQDIREIKEKKPREFDRD